MSDFFKQNNYVLVANPLMCSIIIDDQINYYNRMKSQKQPVIFEAWVLFNGLSYYTFYCI